MTNILPLKNSDKIIIPNLSITPRMLFHVWTKGVTDFKNFDEPNRVELIHPKGWIFTIGKFRNAPFCDDLSYARVRMHISFFNYSSGKIGLFDPFVRIFFGLDLDDCTLDNLDYVLSWMETHSAKDFCDCLNFINFTLKN